MKRLFAALPMLLLVAAGSGLTACSKSAPPAASSANTSVGVSAAASISNSAVSRSAEVASLAPPAADSSASSEAPVQLSETGATETVETPTAGSQPLALKITQVAPSAPTSSQWKEGVNYRVLVPAQPTSALPGQIEVTEAFWYGCPHCNALDPFLENWRKQGKANYVSFVRVPVMWGAVQRTHARVFYTAELVGKLDELHSQIFAEIHDKHDPLTSPEQIETFFTGHGVSKNDFQKAFSSFAVEASLKRAEALGLHYRIESVPTLIVNGKYVTDIGMAGGPQQLIALINELASREKGT